MSNRVVITGMGAITPLGNTVSELWEKIQNGNHGIGPITKFDTSDFKVKIGAEVKNFKPELYMEKKETKRLDLFSQYGLAAATDAMKDSGLNKDDIKNPSRFGVIVGSGIGGLSTLEEQIVKLSNTGKISLLYIPMVISNMAAGHIAIKFGAKGVCTGVVSACTTGTHCVGEAFRNIKHGYSDIIIAGGCEAPITPSGVAGFSALNTLSETKDANRASIPFDQERNGFVIGEGAGALVLESLEHAQARGARIYAEIVGYGSTCDAYHMTAPDENGTGASEAIKQAIAEADISPQDISYINAHGTSTKANDIAETRAIKNVMGEAAYQVCVSSTKSMTGHLLGAAGAVEAIICVNAIQNDFVPPTAGLKNEDAECDLNYTKDKGVSKPLTYALSNSFGFGGHNGVICFKKWR